MVVKARKAQEIYEHHFDQDQVDRVIREARVIYDHAEELARLAVDETGMGVYEHKVAKNRNKSKGVYYNLRGKKSMGIIDMDEKTGLIEIAKPIGVVAGITPMTNPIVTPMSKIIFALKTKNAIIIAPHPQSKRCSALAVNLIKMKGYVPGQDIKIEIVGLRPGEKLYEELLMAEEGLQSTTNDLIFIGKPIDLDGEKFLEELNHLIQIAYNNGDTIKSEIEKVCDTYHPQEC